MEATPEFMNAAKANYKRGKMTNFEKYKTAKEASTAFSEYIRAHGCTYPRCRDCDIFERNVKCQIRWLYAEADTEKSTDMAADPQIDGQMKLEDMDI